MKPRKFCCEIQRMCTNVYNKLMHRASKGCSGKPMSSECWETMH